MPDEGTDEQGLTARERRRRQVEAEQRKQMPKKVIRYTAILVAIAIAIAGGAWAISKINQLAPSCPLEDQHEHANFYVYDEGQRVRFQHPKFDLSGPGRQGVLPLRLHMHQPDDAQLHAEFGCATMGDLFGWMGGELRDNRLRLPPEVGGKTLQEEDAKQLRFFLFEPNRDAPPTGTWREVDSLRNHQPRDCERMLITYGDLSQEEIERQQGQTTYPNDSFGCRPMTG